MGWQRPQDSHSYTVALPCCKPIVINALRISRHYPKEIITFGDHIRAKRLDMGLEQKDVAKALNATTSTIISWEKNRTKPPYTHYKDICDFLDYCPVEKPATTLPLKLLYIRAYMFGMGHREFAKFTGYSESTILKWETGYSRPSIHSADKLSSICDIDVTYKPDEIYSPYARKSGFLPDELPYKIGSHIHAARERKRLSCRQAAKYFQIEHNNFIAWERNIGTPTARYFPAIINFIGYCPVPELSKPTIWYLNRVYLNGRSMARQAKLEGICERTVSKRELKQRTVR